MNQYWIQLLYVHIMVAEVSHALGCLPVTPQ